MLYSWGLGGGGLQDLSVSPSPLFVFFGVQELGLTLDNSGLDTDRQKERQVHVLSCVFAAKKY